MEKSLEFLGQTFPNGKKPSKTKISRAREKRASFTKLKDRERKREEERERDSE